MGKGLQGDCLQVLEGLKPDSVDLVFGSPPYEDARSYGALDFSLKGQDWVDWAVPRFEVCLRICRGLVAWVIQGKTRKYGWSCTPALFMADLHRRGIHLRNPPIFHRVGIPGSGGPDWLRSDYEWVVCATKGGRLPWSDNTAMGHPVKHAPGGEMSHRLRSGARVNQWGGRVERGMPIVTKDGARSGGHRPSHRVVKSGYMTSAASRADTGHESMSGTWNEDGTITRKGGSLYQPLAVANPGNVVSVNTGGGAMGSELASKSVAPFPEKLAAFFVKSFCRPGGIVLDPFSGSGTTAAVAVKTGRDFIAVDFDPRMMKLTRERVREARRKMGLLGV